MRAAFALAAAALLAAPAHAAEPWILDRAHASITFRADHVGFSVVNGRFDAFDAEIAFDRERVEDTRVRVVIEADSIDTGWPERDRHLRGPNFLDADTYPTITFVSTDVDRIGERTATVTGEFTMRGVTREERFDATLVKIGPSPFEPERTIAGFVVEGEIVRADYGMNFGGDAFARRLPVRFDLEMSPAR